jgi:hypothetical protein
LISTWRLVAQQTAQIVLPSAGQERFALQELQSGQVDAAIRSDRRKAADFVTELHPGCPLITEMS